MSEFAPETKPGEQVSVRPPPERPSAPPRTSLVVVAALAAAIGAAASRCGSDRAAPTPTVTTIVRPTPDVVIAVRALARLESTSYQVERVVDLRDAQSVLFGLTTAEDAILLIASGEVVAGVDLSRIRPEQIVVDAENSRVSITLPPSEIFSARLDNDRTFVYSRQTDVLARRSHTLETRARQEAERTLRAAAVEGGILARSDTETRRTIEGLVRALGYRDVTVRVGEQP